MDFSPSARCRELSERIAAFMRDEIAPVEARYAEQLTGDADWRRWRQPDVMETLKAKARAAGLWNLFLPEAEHGGAGLSNAEYAPLAELMGHSFIAPEAFNCNAPDTGNMETLERYGTDAHKAAWLEPLLDGVIRSAFLMTEPEVASSDATNIRTASSATASTT